LKGPKTKTNVKTITGKDSSTLLRRPFLPLCQFDAQQGPRRPSVASAMLCFNEEMPSAPRHEFFYAGIITFSTRAVTPHLLDVESHAPAHEWQEQPFE
jgi:hypothetical protein